MLWDLEIAGMRLLFQGLTKGFRFEVSYEAWGRVTEYFMVVLLGRSPAGRGERRAQNRGVGGCPSPSPKP